MSKKTKRYLMLLAAVGLIAVAAGGSGTFASFSAETANTGNYFATGTLFLHTTKQGGNTCKSEVAGGNSNILSTNGCDVLFNVSQLAANQTATVNLQLANAGSINASAIKFALGAACANGKPTIATTTATVSAGAVTSIALSGLNQALVAGTTIEVSDGTNTDTFTVAASVAAGASSVTVTGTAGSTYASGANVKIAATFGSPNLCTSLQFYVQEKNAGWASNQKCVFPSGGGTNCAFGAQTLNGVGTVLNDLTADLWSGSGNTTALDASKSRYFTIGIKAPASFTNTEQNAQASFDLLWHIDQ